MRLSVFFGRDDILRDVGKINSTEHGESNAGKPGSEYVSTH